jgi:steroid delta-isomerase-like uncharacterized protein
MPKMTGGVKTGRYYIRLPEETIAEIDGYVKESGMYQAYFLSNALIVGARVIARQLNPERFYTHEMVEAIAGRLNQRKGSEQGQVDEPQMLTEQNKRQMRRFFEAFNAGKLDDMFEAMSPEIVFYGATTGKPEGIDGAREWFTMLHNAFPDLRITVESMEADDDKVVIQQSFTGTHKGQFRGVAPTGRHVTVKSTDLIRFADGKHVEQWNNLDVLGLMQQIGAVPAPDQVRA